MTDVQQLVYQITAVACMGAFAGLLWRLIGRWPVSYPLARTVVGLFAALEFIVALAVTRRAALGGEWNEATALVLIHGVITCGVVIFWPWLLTLGDRRE